MTEKELFAAICMYLRMCICGDTKSPNIFEVLEILGKDECMERISNALQ